MRQHKRLFVLFRVIGNLLYNERILKDSAKWYREVIAKNEV